MIFCYSSWSDDHEYSSVFCMCVRMYAYVCRSWPAGRLGTLSVYFSTVYDTVVSGRNTCCCRIELENEKQGKGEVAEH